MTETNTPGSIVSLVSETLVRAGSTFREDKKEAYRQAIEKERNPQACWALKTILENAEAAGTNLSPLCDDTGIPHLILEAGPDRAVTGRACGSCPDAPWGLWGTTASALTRAED